MVEKKIAQGVELGDNDKYEVKGIGTPSFQLESRGIVSIINIFYVPGLKKNLLSISSLEDKGYRVTFVHGQVLAWKKDASFELAKFVGVQIGGLYCPLGCSIQAPLHNTTDLFELWHRLYTHVHYKALSRLKDFVKVVLELRMEHDGVCK